MLLLILLGEMLHRILGGARGGSSDGARGGGEGEHLPRSLHHDLLLPPSSSRTRLHAQSPVLSRRTGSYDEGRSRSLTYELIRLATPRTRTYIDRTRPLASHDTQISRLRTQIRCRSSCRTAASTASTRQHLAHNKTSCAGHAADAAASVDRRTAILSVIATICHKNMRLPPPSPP